VPALVDDEAERLWDIACALHPDWEHVTWRDPIDPSAFPLTSPFWSECESGAQLADLVRAEDLLHDGGWYIDSDVWCLKPFDSLCALEGVAAWEDHLCIPNAVLGFRPGHPALSEVVAKAIDRRGRGTWLAGVGVTTEVFRSRVDMTLLPPGVFYPVHWQDAHRRLVDWREVAKLNPGAFAIHKYAASWHR
jgi:mannosyltransferase OCH1-like enzyme